MAGRIVFAFWPNHDVIIARLIFSDEDGKHHKPSKGDKKRPSKRKPKPQQEQGPIVPVEWDPSTCGRRNVTGSYRIVGGQESRRGSWPWQVNHQFNISAH